MTDIHRLTRSPEAMADELRHLRAELEKAKSERDSAQHSIMVACAGTGCLNAHELRAALDAAHADLDRHRRYVGCQMAMSDFRTADEMRTALAAEREAKRVLAVEAYRQRHSPCGDYSTMPPHMRQQLSELNDAIRAVDTNDLARAALAEAVQKGNTQ